MWVSLGSSGTILDSPASPSSGSTIPVLTIVTWGDLILLMHLLLYFICVQQPCMQDQLEDFWLRYTWYRWWWLWCHCPSLIAYAHIHWSWYHVYTPTVLLWTIMTHNIGERIFGSSPEFQPVLIDAYNESLPRLQWEPAGIRDYRFSAQCMPDKVIKMVYVLAVMSGCMEKKEKENGNGMRKAETEGDSLSSPQRRYDICVSSACL